MGRPALLDAANLPHGVAPAAYVQQAPDDFPPGPPASPLLAEDEAATPRSPNKVTIEVVPAGVTLDEVEQTALANNPTLRQAAARVAQAQGRWLQAGLYPNPQIGYSGSEINAEGSAGQQGGFISQTFVTGGKLNWARAAAAREVERARWQMQVQQQRVLTDVRIQFYEALGAQETAALAEELRAIAAEGVRIARQLETALQAPHTDVLQSEVDLSSAELLVETSRQRAEAARRQLAALVGTPELPPAALVGSLDDETAPLDWSAACARLLSASPLLAAAQAQVAAARAAVRREQVAPVPNVNVQVGSQYDFGSDDALYSAQVQLPLPLYDRNQGNVAAAAAELRRAADEANRLQLVLQDRLAEVWRRYQTAHTQVQVYRTRILPKAQETLDLTTQAYEGGQLDFLRVLTARRAYFENRLEYLRALIALQQARAELDGFLLTGGLTAPGEAALGAGEE